MGHNRNYRNVRAITGRDKMLLLSTLILPQMLGREQEMYAQICSAFLKIDFQ